MATTAFHVDPAINELLRLRCEGHSLAYCAAAVGVSTHVAAKRLAAIAKELLPDREAMVAKQAGQLELLWRRTLAPWVSSDDARQLPLPEKVTQTLLKILDREAKLFGLDAPTKVENSHSFNDATDAELLAEAKRLGIGGEMLAVLTQRPDADADVNATINAVTEAAEPTDAAG